MKLSLTPTLLNSFDWYENCPQSWRKKAFDDLASTIRRLPKEMGAAAKKGIHFEDEVQRRCKAIEQGRVQNDVGSEPFKYIVEQCLGGTFQSWCELYFEHGLLHKELVGSKVRCYGKRDVTFADKVVDIKTTASYKGQEKYLSGWQPPIYCLASGIDRFEFLVAEWESENSYKIKKAYLIPYVLETDALQKVTNRYGEFIKFLQDNGLYYDYLYTYCKNERPLE